jgi:NADH:ubiquinone oxidoreductase subunit 6 (subunit J)
MNAFVSIALMVSILSLALIAVEVKRVLIGIVLLCIMNGLIGVMFWFLYSPFVALFTVLIYVGALAALFLTTASLVGQETILDLKGRARSVGLITSLLVAALLIITLVTEPFPIYSPTDSSDLIAPEITEIISSVSRFLWSERAPDLLAKALVLVSAIACGIYILGKRET